VGALIASQTPPPKAPAKPAIRSRITSLILGNIFCRIPPVNAPVRQFATKSHKPGTGNEPQLPIIGFLKSMAAIAQPSHLAIAKRASVATPAKQPRKAAIMIGRTSIMIGRTRNWG
jgi:hypothetical protein